jgi:hypothetical protein
MNANSFMANSLGSHILQSKFALFFRHLHRLLNYFSFETMSPGDGG